MRTVLTMPALACGLTVTPAHGQLVQVRQAFLPPTLAHARDRLRHGPGPRADRPGVTATLQTRPADDADRSLDARLDRLALQRPGLFPARLQLRPSKCRTPPPS